MAHYFPYDVKLRILAHSRSFLTNQKARNAIFGAENLLIEYIFFSVSLQVFQDKFLIKMASKQKKTTKKIQEYCANYGRDSSEKDLDFSNFIVLEQYKLVCCSVPKVACTVWKRILANLEGYNITNGVHKKTKGKLRILSNYTTEDRSKILKTYKKFMFVRDPFERLLSAYKDCFWGRFKRRMDTWKRYRKAIRFVLATRTGLDIGVNSTSCVIHAKYSLIMSAITKHCKMTHNLFYERLN